MFYIVDFVQTDVHIADINYASGRKLNKYLITRSLDWYRENTLPSTATFSLLTLPETAKLTWHVLLE